AFTQIVAMEMQRYGVTANAIAPAARTRMTEQTFGGLMPGGGEGFDPYAPENVAPMVTFLATDAAADITGQVFYVQGGIVQLYQGWTPVAAIEQDARGEPEGIAARIGDLFAGRSRAYSPARSPLRQAVAESGDPGAPSA